MRNRIGKLHTCHICNGNNCSVFDLISKAKLLRMIKSAYNQCAIIDAAKETGWRKVKLIAVPLVRYRSLLTSALT